MMAASWRDICWSICSIARRIVTVRFFEKVTVPFIASSVRVRSSSWTCSGSVWRVALIAWSSRLDFSSVSTAAAGGAEVVLDVAM